MVRTRFRADSGRGEHMPIEDLWYVEFMNHAKANGMRVIIDLVVNHTSVDHPRARALEVRRVAG
jgi:hypothetical protein